MVEAKIFPDMLEAQCHSFCWFLSTGLKEEFSSVSKKYSYTNDITYTILGGEYSLKLPKYGDSEKYYIERLNFNNTIKIKVPIRIKIKKKIKNYIVIENLIIYFPMMTAYATFLVNGLERVILSQISRSPGIIFDKTNKRLTKRIKNLVLPFNSFHIQNLYRTNYPRSEPKYGELNISDYNVKFDFEDDYFDPEQEHAYFFPPIDPKVKDFFDSFDFKEDSNFNYDSEDEEFKFRDKTLDKKQLHIYFQKILYSKRIKENIYSAVLIPESGPWTVFKMKEKKIEDNSNAFLIDILLSSNRFSEISIFDTLRNIGLTDFEIYNNLTYSNWFYSSKPLYNINKKFKADYKYKNFLKIFDPAQIPIGSIGRLKINNLLNLPINESIISITYNDIFAIIDKFAEFMIKEQFIDDKEHLKNKRIKLPGKILQDVIHRGFYRLITGLSRRNMTDKISKINLNHHIISNSLSEFFTSSSLCQFLDQINPLSTLTHSRRISYYGNGGLKKGAVSLNVRDIHPSQYGRICPVETVEGSNVGAVNSLAIYAKINKTGLLETPFWRVINGKVLKEANPLYLTADIEDSYKIAAADTLIDSKNYLTDKYITVRYRQRFINVPPGEVDFLAISPIQIVSIAASLVPFFEHNDANRVLMGSSMQRQSVPLLYSQKPIVGTGFETLVVTNSETILKSKSSGIVDFVSSNKIIINQSKDCSFTYNLQKQAFSNQKTYVNQRPIVWKGETVKCNQSLTDGPSILDGELSLGRNLLVAYMPWHGYNFEDAILINERLIYDNVFTSIHVEKYRTELGTNKNIKEYFTKKIPKVEISLTKNLDENGIIKVGTVVKSGDILAGKVALPPKKDERPISKLIRAAFKDKSPYSINMSLKLPNGKYGRIIRVSTSTTRKKNIINQVVIWIVQIRKIQVGDKLAGRHGNKGVISKVLARQDMPFLPDGTPIDILLNPLGVPSRMNVGQLYECLLGLAGSNLNKRFKVLPFDEMYGPETSRILINKKLRQASIKQNKSWLFNPYMPGKMVLIDGQTGIEFENPITVGNAYILKLIHLVDDKIHSRYIGPYSVITQQPVRGKALRGGQRFGEMEVWALEGFGAAHSLRELLTIKSDNIIERDQSVSNIGQEGEPTGNFGVPESFKVFLQELRAVGLDIKTYKLKNFTSIKSNGSNEVQTLQQNIN
uniref:DNA-directed RNA polymerase subunit beta n=1 Tax=Nitzschia sp. NIES-3576 TaxID=2083273 RepID=A0A2Z5ZBF6_9STRA|nr:RNA polymerase beta subunit [Nitzschia sp. NIES-3576]